MAVDIETIGIAVDTKGVKQGTRDLDALNRSADKASRSADKLGTSHAKTAKDTDSLGKASASAASSVGKLAGAYAAFTALRGLTRQIDEYTKFNAQLKLATRSQEQYNTALSDVRRIATTAQASLGSIGVLYARLNNALRDLGVSQQRVAVVTENVGLALKVSGATAQESASAMLQLSQAFGSGVLRGEEFNAVNEAAPALMRALAESMGVSVGALRELASEGQITSEVLLKAFGDEKLLALFRQQATEVNTISGAWQTVKNSINEAIGRANEYLGLSKKINEKAALLTQALSPATDAEKAYKARKEIERLQGFGGAMYGANYRQKLINDQMRILDPKIGNKLPGSSAENGTFAPNFKVSTVDGHGGYGTDVKVINKLKEDQLRAQKEISDDAKKLQKEKEKIMLDWYERENSKIVDDIEKRNKIELDYFDRTNKQIVKDIEHRNKVEQDYFKRTNDAIVKEIEERGRAYKEMARDLERSLTDALLRGFESGKDFAQTFRDTLKNMFQTLVLRPAISAIVSPVAGAFSAAFSGNAMAGGSGSAGGFGGFGNIASIGKSLYEGLGGVQASITGGIEKLGTMLVSGNGGFMDSIGGFLGANAGTIGNALPFAGAAMQALTGDIKGAAFTAVGSAIGLAFGMPAIGGMVGGLVGSLFGGSGEKYKKMGQARSGSFDGSKFTSVQGKYSGKAIGAASDPIDALNEQFSRTLSGLLGAFDLSTKVLTASTIRQRRTSGKLATNFDAHFAGGMISMGGKAGQFGGDGNIEKGFAEFSAAVMGKYFVEAVQKSKLPGAIKSLFDGLVVQNQITGMVQGIMKLKDAQVQLNSVYGISVIEAAKIAKATGLAGDELMRMTHKIANAANAYKTAGDILMPVYDSLLERLGKRGVSTVPESLKAFDAVLNGIDTTSGAGIKQFAELFKLRDEFASFDKVIGGLKTGVRGSIFGMSSPAEQAAMQKEDLEKMFGDLGRDVPGSIQELIDLGKTIDYTTKEGLDLAAVFPSLVQAFQQTQGAVDGLINSLRIVPDSFRTYFEFSRALAYQKNGISLDRLPSYDVGTSYVPQDGPAMIHRGERILTAEQNKSFGSGNSDSAAAIREVKQGLSNMSRELQAIAISSLKIAKSVEIMQKNGIVVSTEDNDGNQQVIPVEVVV
jgi:tape measure domain-containing protein